MESFILDVMDIITEMSYQRFKLTRRLSKIGIIASAIYFIRGFIMMVTFDGEIDPANPELIPYFNTLTFNDIMISIVVVIIAIMSMSCYMAMSQGKTNHDRYKKYCADNYYKPFNATKH